MNSNLSTKIQSAQSPSGHSFQMTQLFVPAVSLISHLNCPGGIQWRKGLLEVNGEMKKPCLLFTIHWLLRLLENSVVFNDTPYAHLIWHNSWCQYGRGNLTDFLSPQCLDLIKHGSVRFLFYSTCSLFFKGQLRRGQLDLYRERQTRRDHL